MMTEIVNGREIEFERDILLMACCCDHFNTALYTRRVQILAIIAHSVTVM